MGMWNKRNEWLVREHECCHEWTHCERVHVTDVLTGADGLSSKYKCSPEQFGWTVRGQKCCQEWMDCKRALSEKYKLSQN